MIFAVSIHRLEVSIDSLANSPRPFPIAYQICKQYRQKTFKMWVITTPLTLLVGGIVTAIGIFLLLKLGAETGIPFVFIGGAAIPLIAVTISSTVTYEGGRKLKQPLDDAPLRARLEEEMGGVYGVIDQVVENASKKEPDEGFMRYALFLDARICQLVQNGYLGKEGDEFIYSIFIMLSKTEISREKLKEFEKTLNNLDIKCDLESLESGDALSSISTV